MQLEDSEKLNELKSDIATDPIFFEKALIRFLLTNKKVEEVLIPFLREEIFDELNNKEIIKEYISYIRKYNVPPKSGDLRLLLNKSEDLTNRIDHIIGMDISSFTPESLLEEIEDFIRRKLIFHEITIITEKLQEGHVNEIDPNKISESKAFSFKTSVGMDVFSDDGEDCYNFIHSEDKYIPTSFKKFNLFMAGGFQRKALTLFIGGTNVGKTLMKCAYATDILLAGGNVLYISLEMSKEKIRERIIQNALDCDFTTLKTISKDEFKRKWKEAKNRINNKIIIEEYPATTFSANRLRLLLKELKEKNKFTPDIIFIDYLELMTPSVISKDANSNTLLKRVSEEIHGVSKENEISVVSSMQFNREGLKSSDPDMDDVSSSIGTVFTADDVILIIQDEELYEQNKYKLKKAKSRFTRKGITAYLNVDYNKMKVWEDTDTTINAKEEAENKEKINSAVSDISNFVKKDIETKKKRVFDYE